MAEENPLKIIMLSSAIGTSTGGLGSYVTNLKHALQRRGHDVTLLRPVERFSIGPFLRTLIYNAQCLRVLGSTTPTIIHSHTYDGSLVPRTGAPFIATLHGVLADEVKYFSKFQDRAWARLLARLEALNCRRADRCTAVSEYSRRIAADMYNLSISDIEVVPACINLDVFEPAKRRPPSKTRRVLFVGRIYHRKGLQVLLRAMAILRDKEVSLWIVGTGPDQPRMKRIVRALGLSEQVRFLDIVPLRELVHCYQTSDVVCIPSLQEGLSIVALEAQACGTPVVGTRVGGLPEAVADRKLLASPGDPYELSAALAHVLYGRYGEGPQWRCREFIEKNFSSWKVSEKMESIYRQVL